MFERYGHSMEMGAPIFTTSRDAASAINTLVADVNNLNTHVTAWWQQVKSKATKEQTSFVNSWINWRDAAYSMAKEAASGTSRILDTAWGIVDRANEKTKELQKWRATFEKVSGEKVSVPQTEYKEPPKGEPSLWLYVSVGLAGAAATLYALRKTGG